jgi:thiol-disulfide isomerase/thioredoxin
LDFNGLLMTKDPIKLIGSDGGPRADGPEAPRLTLWQRLPVGLFLTIALVVGAVAFVNVFHHPLAGGPAVVPSVPASADFASHATGEVAAFSPSATRTPLPNISFTDEAGRTRSLADWRGKVVLLNLWATWCVPCRAEIPSLDALEASLGGKDFDVLAISTDLGAPEKPRKFLDQAQARSLKLYLDRSGSSKAIGVIGLPTTLLIDREGREIGRLVGPAQWSSADAKALITAAIAEKG